MLWILPAAGVVVLAWRGRRRGGQVLPFWSLLLCVTGMSLVGLSLADPMLRDPRTANPPWLLLRDVSASMRGQTGRILNLGNTVTVEEIRFAGGLQAPGQPPSTGSEGTRAIPPLQLALTRRETIGGIVLYTDGRFDDDPRALLARLARSGLTIFLVPADSPPRDVRIGELTANRLEGGLVELAVTVESNAMLQRELTIRQDVPEAKPVSRTSLSFLPHQPITFRWRGRLDPQEAGAWTASLSPSDPLPENDSASVAVRPMRRQPWLIAPASLRPAGALAGLRRVDPSSGLAGGKAFLDASAVVLADESGRLLHAGARESLAEAVRSGVGLVLLGVGPHGRPSDRTDPLNEIAALRPDPFGRHPLALTVVVDASGSMAQPTGTAPGGQRSFDLAIEAVTALRNHLTSADMLRVLVFADEPREIYTSKAGPPDIPALREALQMVRQAGPTHLGPALAHAVAQPAPQDRPALVLVLSDLATEPFEPADLASQIRQSGWSMAVIAIGDEEESNLSLETLTARLDAPLLRRDSLEGLADLFGRLCRQQRGKIAQPGTYRIRATEPWQQLEVLAPLSVVLETSPAGDAEVLAEAVDATRTLPLLAWRQAGLGQSFTLALPGLILTDPAWADAITRLADRAGRKGNDPRCAVRFNETLEGLSLTATLREEGLPVLDQILQAEVVDLRTGQTLETASMDLDGMGTYGAVLRNMPAGPAGIDILDHSGGVLWSDVVSPAVPRELGAPGADRRALHTLAEAGNANIVSPTELVQVVASIRAESTDRAWRPWPVLLGAGLVLVLLHWALPVVLRWKNAA